MKKCFIGVYNPSIILTFLGSFSALVGMSLLLSSAITNPLKIAMILLVISGVCDLFDGRIAQLCKRNDMEKRFGIELDSLADTVSFVALPACILLFVTDADISGIIITFFYVFAGVMRLAFFNVTTEDNPGFYRGLPVTYAAVIFPIVYTIFLAFDISLPSLAFKILFSLVGVLFILNFKIKKPKLIGSVLFALLAIATVVALIII